MAAPARSPTPANIGILLLVGVAAGDGAAGRAIGAASSLAATRVFGTCTWIVASVAAAAALAAAPCEMRARTSVPIVVMLVAGMRSIACTRSCAYSDAFRYRSFA